MQPATDQQAEWFSHWFNALLDNVEQVIKGKRDQIALALVCLFSEGHLLLDDVPGTGKTSLAKAIAHSVKGTWSRIQFTPDLLPSDVTGGLVYNQSQSTFDFRRGAVFSNVVLADEINRASPKTQAALLEVMEERHVTVDGDHLRRAAAVRRHRHAEPRRAGGHVPPARGPARPLLDAHHARLPRPRPRGRGAGDARRGAPPRGVDAGDDDERRAHDDPRRRVGPRRGLRAQLRRAPVRGDPVAAPAAPRRVHPRRHRHGPHGARARRGAGAGVRHARRRAHRRPGRDGPPHAADARGRAEQGRHQRPRRRGPRPRRAARPARQHA